jgi:hypothetical protein
VVGKLVEDEGDDERESAAEVADEAPEDSGDCLVVSRSAGFLENGEEDAIVHLVDLVSRAFPSF